MSKPRRIPLHALLLLLAVSGLLPLAITSGIGLLLLDAHHREQTRRLGIGAARALSTAVDAELNRALSVLQVLAAADELDSANLEGFRVHAERALRTQRDWLMIGLANPDGQHLVSTSAEPGAKPRPVVERESFRRLLQQRTPVIGFLQRGPGGRYAVPVRVPVMDNGSLRYVLSGVISPEAFLDVVRRQKVREDWVISIFDAGGKRVARSRGQQGALGTAASPSLQEAVQGAREGWELTYTLEGDPVYTAFSRSAETGWMVAVGIPEPLVREGSARTLLAYGSGLLMSIGLGLMAVASIARRITIPMASLRAGARTLARGEVPVVAPSAVTELREVSDALLAAGEERARIEQQRERLLRSEREARAAAERANRFKDEFVSMLSHELRNPIAALTNAARVLEPPEVEPAVANRAREVVRRQSAHLGRLADDLLVAESAIQGRIVLEPHSVELAAATREVLDNMLAAREVQTHRVSTDLQPVWVRADSLRLAQMVARLLDNAFKFTPDGGTIHVATRGRGGQGIVTVTDSGIGMTPELAERVFELFAQAEREPHRPQGGLGIGLTLVRRLAELHGGSASAHSAGPGKGSEFELRLPRAPAPVDEQAPPATPLAAQSRHVLLVEDNLDACTMMRLLLQSAGHRVRVAHDGVQGLQAILDEPPDVALIDIGLPRMDGYEVARRVHEAFAARPRPFLVAITGYGLPADKERALAAGFDVHLVKPVDFAALEAILARLGR